MYTRAADLEAARYVSLTTRRRDGSLVSTPVWVVSDDGRRLLVWTSSKSGKARRIRRDGRVLVAPCDYRGRERGPRLAATARLLGTEAAEVVVPLLRRKYGWQRRLLELQARLVGRRGPPAAYLEVR